MDLERVIAALAPRDVVGRAPLDVTDLAYDTRAVTPGALFFCVRGANADGHELAPQAVAAGAAALVVERPLSLAHVPQIVVADSRAAIADPASSARSRRAWRASAARSSVRRPRRSTSSAPSARCSTPATKAAQWRPR